eukprot:9479744-Pyramimonas_sp.AAC.1
MAAPRENPLVGPVGAAERPKPADAPRLLVVAHQHPSKPKGHRHTVFTYAASHFGLQIVTEGTIETRAPRARAPQELATMVPLPLHRNRPPNPPPHPNQRVNEGYQPVLAWFIRLGEAH